MIGQKELLQIIENQIKEGLFPRFSIIVGLKGSGKKLFTDEIVTLLDIQRYAVGIKIEEVRKAITDAYKIFTPTVFLIWDADNMSTPARNALLKLVEEPPNNAYFIMTLEDVNNTLETIKSRAVVYNMQNYTVEELKEYVIPRVNSRSDIDIILDLCENPGEINELVKVGVKDFYDYVELVIDNIAEVTGANSFKIADKIALKPDAEGYDLKMFFKAFMSICIKRIPDNSIRYSAGVSITSKFLQEMNIKGVSKQMLIDDWILTIRQAWME